MDLRFIEKAAEVIFEMCRQHPEICPHDYHWSMSRIVENGKEEKHYTCGLCGNEIVEVK